MEEVANLLERRMKHQRNGREFHFAWYTIDLLVHIKGSGLWRGAWKPTEACHGISRWRANTKVCPSSPPKVKPDDRSELETGILTSIPRNHAPILEWFHSRVPRNYHIDPKIMETAGIGTGLKVWVHYLGMPSWAWYQSEGGGSSNDLHWSFLPQVCDNFSRWTGFGTRGIVLVAKLCQEIGPRTPESHTALFGWGTWLGLWSQ